MLSLEPKYRVTITKAQSQQCLHSVRSMFASGLSYAYKYLPVETQERPSKQGIERLFASG
jgi:hypothetical protein